MKKFLLIVNSGLGDAFSVIPVIHTLKNKYPQSMIDIYSDKAYALLLFGTLPQVNDLTTSLKPGYDVIFFFTNVSTFSFKKLFIYKLTNWKCTIISHINPRKLVAYGLKKLIFKIKPVDYNRHIIFNNLSLLSHLTIKENEYIFQNGLNFKPITPLKPNLPELFVVINIGASSGEITPKLVGIKEWVQLISLINQRVSIILVGHSNDRKYLNHEILNLTNVIDLVGKTTLEELAYILQKACCAISADSGFAHLAASIPTKLFVLWGPSIFTYNRPLNLNNANLVSYTITNLPCSPCYGGYLQSERVALQNCPYNNKCMKELNMVNLAQKILIYLESN